ncbi:MAG: DUF364 domain-containing protein [Tenuifilaceae bacterium]
MSVNVDILQQLYHKYPFQKEGISRLVCGAKYCGIELTNGHIGICSTLGVKIEKDETILVNPDFKKIEHRILVNAWINACANYSLPVNGEGDVFDAVNFYRYKNVVMIGFFGSLSTKFQNAGIPITIFDLDPTDKPVAPIETQHLHLAKADAVILTATSISNMTFTSLMQNVEHADVFILGPSTTLDNDLLNYPKVKALFGSRFTPHDKNSLDLIESGAGTKSLLPFIKKVYLYR